MGTAIPYLSWHLALPVHTHTHTFTPRTSHHRASLVAQSVKSLTAVQETWVQPLSWKIPWRRKWQPIPVFLPGESQGRRSLVGYSLRVTRVRHDWPPTTMHERCRDSERFHLRKEKHPKL